MHMVGCTPKWRTYRVDLQTEGTDTEGADTEETDTEGGIHKWRGHAPGALGSETSPDPHAS